MISHILSADLMQRINSFIIPFSAVWMSCTPSNLKFDLQKIKYINTSLIFPIHRLNKKLIDIKVFVKSCPCISWKHCVTVWEEFGCVEIFLFCSFLSTSFFLTLNCFIFFLCFSVQIHASMYMALAYRKKRWRSLG